MDGLEPYRLERFKYELVGARTVTVRDQMLRAQRVARELFHQGGDVKPGQAVLILGGGAAGVTLAMLASIAGRVAVIIEEQVRAFDRLQGVTTRRICPTEFDWPQTHWAAEWPPEGSGEIPLPLSYRHAKVASDAAREWQDRFREVLETSGTSSKRYVGRVHLVRSTDWRKTDLKRQAGHFTITVADTEVSGLKFAAVVSCVGHGMERVFLTHDGDDKGDVVWNGMEFWSSDLLCEENLQVWSGGHFDHYPILALVSGGGDGALQDIQRILCAEFGRALLEGPGRVFEKLPIVKNMIEAAQPALWEADKARHAALQDAAATPEQRAEALATWDDRYRTLANEVWHALKPDAQNVLKQVLLRPEVRKGNLRLTWLLRSQHADHCFGLNRFLAELVMLAYASYTGLALWKADSWNDHMPATMVGHQVVSVEYNRPGSHTCTPGFPELCVGARHVVSFAKAENRNVRFKREYHVIVLRHGVMKDPAFGGMPGGEQLMPFGPKP